MRDASRSHKPSPAGGGFSVFLPPFGRWHGVCAPDVEAGLARLAETLPAVDARAVQEEFWYLFGALGPAAAPPWESVYLDREHVIFGAETLQMRALYARFGLVFDHIGLELEFLARLTLGILRQDLR